LFIFDMIFVRIVRILIVIIMFPFVCTRTEVKTGKPKFVTRKSFLLKTRLQTYTLPVIFIFAVKFFKPPLLVPSPLFLPHAGP